jgi:O-acetyl-ADP-ribose deacetylase (regulator of RNase III)
MIIYKNGSIFNGNDDCIVNPVNTVGVMGGGLAAEFKVRFPSMFSAYKKHCDSNELRPGLLMFFRPDPDSPVVCCFPTKLHWRNPSQLSYIESGLKSFNQFYKEWDIKSVSFPKLGCGLGGLNWEHEVQPLMQKYLDTLDITVHVYI